MAYPGSEHRQVPFTGIAQAHGAGRRYRNNRAEYSADHSAIRVVGVARRRAYGDGDQPGSSAPGCMHELRSVCKILPCPRPGRRTARSGDLLFSCIRRTRLHKLQAHPPLHRVLPSYHDDEKPGIQAISTTSDDLMPDEKHSTISRDYEYKRLGTVSLLAGIDLQTGEAIPLIRDKHSSKEYIEFLQLLDSKYPKGDKIRLVLDNLKVHTSDETRKYLATIPDRFEFVFTPKHGSWLNLVEGFFSKMTRQMLKDIRVKTKEELIQRIYQYFTEVNTEPVVYHWKYKLEEIDPDEEVQVETLLIKKSS